MEKCFGQKKNMNICTALKSLQCKANTGYDYGLCRFYKPVSQYYEDLEKYDNNSSTIEKPTR